MHLNESHNLSAETNPEDQLFSFHAFDNLPIAIYSCDKNGYITAFNKAAIKIWGRTPEIGKDQWSGALKTFSVDGGVLRPEHGPMARSIQQQIPVEEEEIVIEQPDGNRLRVHVNPMPVFDDDGRLKGAVYTMVDVTAARDAEVKQAMLAAIIDTSDDAIVSKTLKGIITSWNAAAERMFGYTAAEAVGKHISLIIPPDRLQEEDYIIGKISSGQKVDHFETVRMTKSRKLIPISVTISPITDSRGHIIGASKIARDISERLDTGAQQARLAAIVNSSDDTIVSKTLQGIITSWNAAAERMFGYTAEEAIGKHISMIIPPDRLKEEEYIIGQISLGNKVDHFETIRVAKNGKPIPLSITVSPIIDSKGHVIGASKIARDISQQKKAQQDLLEHAAKLETISSENARLYREVKALNEKKDEFIGLASHELKTPITSIMGYLQILTRFTKDKDVNKFVGKTLRQVKKLSGLVSDLLDVSKIEAGKLQLVKEKFDIRPIIDDAIELIQHTNATHHIALNTDVPSAITCGDPQRIEQVIINLLTNAIKYSPQGKEVELFLSVDSRQVKIGVKDNGIGIPAGWSKYLTGFIALRS